MNYHYDLIREVNKHRQLLRRHAPSQRLSVDGPAYEAYCKAADAGKRLPELEGIILTSPFYAYAYAIDVIKDRWIEAEDIIMLDPLVVCLYAIRLIKGKVSEKMHNMMILHGIENPENGHVISYFEFIEKPYSPDASIHLSLDP